MSKLTTFYKLVPLARPATTMTDSQAVGDQGSYANYTWYQRLIQGSASRITRYREYDLMDNDVEIARGLDTIAEEMIGNPTNETSAPIELVIHPHKSKYVSHSDVETLQSALHTWNEIHEWDRRLFSVCRNTIKYGDCVFIRGKETQRWQYVPAKDVIAAIVDERDVYNIIGWQIRKNIHSPNNATSQALNTLHSTPQDAHDTYAADRVIRFTLNDDMSESAPYGESILRSVYRAQKQKELIQDAIIIYRIQRAPERRVFYIDVGKMPPQRSKQYLDQVKNEIRQKKIPSFAGGVDQVDSVYNPQSMQEDFFFAQRPDGRGSRVETLPGGQGLGELSDLEFFQKQVWDGLKIPRSYMKSDDGTPYSDGKTGVAYMEEMRFALYISRLAQHINRTLDQEFKRFIRSVGIAIDPTNFKIKLQDPENFGIYKEQQLNSDLLGTYASADSISALSKRFSFRKYLKLTEEEIKENERMKMEELGMTEADFDLTKIYGDPALEDPMAGMEMDAGLGMVAGAADQLAATGGQVPSEVPPNQAPPQSLI